MQKTKNWINAKNKRTLQYYLEKIPAIGDSTRDLEAYSKSEAQPILVRTGNGKVLKKRNPSQLIP